MAAGEIQVRGLLEGESGKPFLWTLLPGQFYLVAGSTGNPAGKLLAHLAGHRQDNRLNLEKSTTGRAERLQSLPSSGVLPPAGEEIFVGTTIGEQLHFFDEKKNSRELEQSGLDRLFEFNFSDRRGESVWELGAGERRCLLLVSQALARPRFWVLNDPLDRLDGPRCRAVTEFTRTMIERGDTIITSSRNPEELLGICTRVLLLGADGLSVDYFGNPECAAGMLAELT